MLEYCFIVGNLSVDYSFNFQGQDLDLNS